MLYRRVTPNPPLHAFVHCLWFAEGFDGAHHYERLLPNGESSIVIDLRQEPIRIYSGENIARFETYAPAIYCGARTDSFVIDTCRQERVAGIQFRPGGAAAFLPMPAHEVANATYSLDDIWPGQANLLREELLAAPTLPRLFAILERPLLARLSQSGAFHPAIAFAAARLASPTSQPGLRVTAVADRVGLSSRRFMDLFRDQTGLHPKAFQRVRRFQQVLQTLHSQSRNRIAVEFRQGNWAALAASCGYYDQPHFIHDFRHFAGMTPSAYLAAATAHLNHVPL